MKTAIVTCNIGGIDDGHEIPNTPDFYYYTEKNLPFPLPHLNNRLKGKYLKIMTHRFLPQYDNYIWLDGVVKPTKELIEYFQSKLQDKDIAIAKHPYRNNVFEELLYIQKKMNLGREYLLKRYKDEPFGLEAKFYKKEKLPDDFPLYHCRLFIRRNEERVNRTFDEWWNKVIEFSNFDQSQFSYIAWKYGLRIKQLDYKELEKRTKISRHKEIK